MPSSHTRAARPDRPSGIPPAKLTPPAAQDSQVTRAALVDRIARAAGIRLVLIHAAAGFGKTTLMAQLLGRFRQDGIGTGWLTLDPSDNDASRFLASLTAAAASFAKPSRAKEAPVNILELLARHDEPFALFLDDFESLQPASVLALVRTLLDGLPHGARLVIGSRNLPDLSIARLRARGQVLEIDADALRFSADETVDLFRRQHGTAVSGNVVRQLNEQTEGWIAALWLASRSLQATGERPESLVERFSGSTRAIADYLAEDVFSRQPEQVREFLLRSSILRHLEVPLCQALMPRCDVAEMLMVLERQNLFLVSLPGRSPAWRYHRLFGDFLRARLLQARSEEAFRLHLLAAAWYESEGRPVPAIDHAIDAGDHPLAVSLLAPHAQRLLEEGRMRLLCRWFDAIPPSFMESHPVLHAVAVWATLFTRGPLQATARLEGSGCLSSNDPHVQAHVNALRPLLLSMRDRYDDALTAGRDSLDRLPTPNTFADGVLRYAMAHVFTVMGESTRAQQLIDEARRATGDSGFSRMYAESVEGMLDLQAGRLRMATVHFRAAVSVTHDASHNYTSGNAWAGVLYASVRYETHDFQEAERLVDVYLPMACDVGLPGHISVGHLIRCRIAFSRGEIDRSFEALTDLEYMGHYRQLPRIVANAKLERARLLLLRGDAQASKEELDRAEDPELVERLQRQRLPANETDYPALARARWTLHFGDARAVTPWLERELARALEQQRHRRALRLRVLHSLALQRAGDPAAATTAMATAVRLAAQEGFVQTIADEGPEVGRIVQRLHAMLQQMPANRSDPGLMQHLDRLLLAFGSLTRDAGGAAPDADLIEPLTRKEIQVLQLVADGHSNGAMADKLGASDSTVRTHLRSINAKLGAHSRTEAVVVGRRLGVIR
jgi:LuxR family transcriptional regulator, maltose regulon positive regulatory protein